MLDEHPVVVIRSGSTNISSLLLSVCTHKAGWPRSVVGSTKASVFCCYNPTCCSKGRRLKCEHCTTASDWLKGIQEQLDQEGSVTEDLEVLADLAAELEGMHLQSQHVAVDALQEETTEQATGMLPVSRSKIAPDMSHEVIQQRMAGTLGMSSHTRQRSSVHSACHCLQLQK